MSSAAAPEAASAELDALARSSWFAAAGEKLTPAECEEAAAYLAALGLANPAIAGPAIAGVAGWDEAKRIADAPDWDRRWWDAEEALRRAALMHASARLGHDALMAALSHVTQAAADTVHGAAAIAAQRAEIADPALVRAATGAATQACYQAALALTAGAGQDHAFAVKHRLFAAGRWPLGLVEGRFFLL
jgi:hypothetical protein